MSYDFTGKRVYLSGPMSGKPDWNKPAFDAAERALRDMGAVDVYNPAAFVPADGEAFHPHESYMLTKLHELTKHYYAGYKRPAVPYYDAIVMLPRWYGSKGASVEYGVAVACGIDVVYYGDEVGA